jgi:hypothetical protein
MSVIFHRQIIYDSREHRYDNEGGGGKPRAPVSEGEILSNCQRDHGDPAPPEASRGNAPADATTNK